MKVLNIIWGFSLGAGIDKCFLTYDSLSSVDTNTNVSSVCINLENLNSHIEPLLKRNVSMINIKNRRDLSWIKKLDNLVKAENPDILFAHGFNGAIMMAIIRLFIKNKTPFICTYHGAYHAPTRLKKFLEPIYNGLPILIYKYLAKHTICVEHFSRNYLLAKGVKRVSTVHNGIPDLKITHEIETLHSTPILVTASRITEVKGLTYLLKALSILKKKGIDFHYQMIGDGPLLNSLIAQSKDLGLTDSDISFLGYQSDIPKYLNNCDLFLLPSLHEYHSIAILEAMRSQCAIIATNVGGNCESITDKKEGLIIPPKNSNALASAIEYMLNNQNIRDLYAKNARQRYEHEFTEDAMKRGIIKIMKS